MANLSQLLPYFPRILKLLFSIKYVNRKGSVLKYPYEKEQDNFRDFDCGMALSYMGT